MCHGGDMTEQTTTDDVARPRPAEEAPSFDVRQAAAGAVLGGLSGLIPIGRLHGWGLRAYVAAPAVFVVPVGWVATRQQAETSGPSSSSSSSSSHRVAIVAAAAAAISTGQMLGVVVDRRAEGWLRSRGVARPRLVMAAASAVVGAVAAGRSSDERDGETRGGGD